LKKVVVECGEPVFFEGEDLKVINRGNTLSSMEKNNILVIMDGKEELGVFQTWLYWKKIE